MRWKRGREHKDDSKRSRKRGNFLISLVKGLVLGLVLLIGLPILATALYGWNIWRTPLAYATDYFLGRMVAIEGDLLVKRVSSDDLFLVRVAASDVKIENAPAAHQRHFLTWRQASVDIAPMAFLKDSDTVVYDVMADKVQVFLERQPNGSVNWDFSSDDLQKDVSDQQAAPDAGEPTLGQEGDSFLRFVPLHVYVNDSSVLFRDHQASKTSRGHIAELTFLSAGPGQPLIFKARGDVGGQALSVDGKVETDGKPLDQAGAIAFELSAASGSTHLTAKGDLLADPPLRVNAHAAVSGQNLAEAGQVLLLNLPASKPYKAEADIGWSEGKLSVTALKAGLGGSDFSGAFGMDTQNANAMKIDLRSQRLDPYDLVPPAGPGDKAAGSQTQGGVKAEKKTVTNRDGEVVTFEPMFSRTALPWPDLQGVVIDARYRAASVVSANEQLADIGADLQVNGRNITLESFDVGFAGGRILMSGKAEVSPEAGIRFNIDGEVKALDIGRLLKDAELMKLAAKGKAGKEAAKMATGKVFGKLQLASSGGSPHTLVSGLDGSVAVVLVDGRMSELVLELVAIDLTEAIAVFFGKKENSSDIECLVGATQVKKGVFNVDTLLLVTKDTDVVGKGKIDLPREQVDITLKPVVRDASLGAAATPMHIGGHLRKPELNLDPGPLVLRGIAAVALGAFLAPAAAVIPFVETGMGQENSCSKALARLQSRARKSDAEMQGRIPPSGMDKSRRTASPETDHGRKPS